MRLNLRPWAIRFAVWLSVITGSIWALIWIASYWVNSAYPNLHQRVALAESLKSYSASNIQNLPAEIDLANIDIVWFEGECAIRSKVLAAGYNSDIILSTLHRRKSGIAGAAGEIINWQLTYIAAAAHTETDGIGAPPLNFGGWLLGFTKPNLDVDSVSGATVTTEAVIGSVRRLQEYVHQDVQINQDVRTIVKCQSGSQSGRVAQ